MHHLIFGLWWFSGRIKEPKVCVLQANAKLAQKGEVQGSKYSLGVKICYWKFLFSRSTVSDANTGIIANFV